MDTEAYVKELYPDFMPWFSDLVKSTKPDFIVSVARGAFRLLQVKDVVSENGNPRIITDRALPFLPDQEIAGRVILLFDDSIIFGSTMARVRNYLVSRGASVACASYAADKLHFFGEQSSREEPAVNPSPHTCIDPIVAKRLSPEEIRRHHAELVDHLMNRAKPYNLDFPTLRFKCRELDKEHIPLLCSAARRLPMVRSVHCVTDGLSATKKLHKYSFVLQPPCLELFSSPNVRVRDQTKIRVSFLLEKKEINLTAITQLMTEGPMQPTAFVPSSAKAKEIWESLSFPECWDDYFAPRGVFRLLTYYHAIVLSAIFLRQWTTQSEMFDGCPGWSLVPHEAQAVIGSQNTRVFWDTYADVLHSPDLVENFGLKLDPVTIDDEPMDEDLLSKVRQVLTAHSKLQPEVSDSSYDAVAKLLLAMREVTDSRDIRRNSPSAKRLDRGLTYSEITTLLHEYAGSGYSADELSAAVDICVDLGQAVPKIIKRTKYWLRAFYTGEGDQHQRQMQFALGFHGCYDEWCKEKKAFLNRFSTHKLCTALRDVIDWIPISRKFNTFGRWATIGSEEIVEWLENRDVLKCTAPGNESVVAPSTTYSAPVGISLPHDTAHFFEATFEVLASVISKLDIPGILVLTTCRTHRHSFCAVAIEMWNWVNHPYGMFRILSAARRILNGESSEDKRTAAIALYWCSRFLSQAALKDNIFHRRFGKLSEQVKMAFDEQGPTGRRFWEHRVLGPGLLSSATDREIEMRFDLFRQLSGHARLVTAYVAKVLVESNLMSMADIASVFREHKAEVQHKSALWLWTNTAAVTANKYNQRAEDSKLPYGCFLKTRLSMLSTNELHAGGIPKALESAEACYHETAKAFEYFFPHYDVPEGEEYPFAPQYGERLREDGIKEQDFRNQYLLVYDVIGSQTNPEAQTMLAQVQDATRALQAEGTKAEFTANDGSPILCPDAKTLWSLLQKLKFVGAPYHRVSSGLRKAVWSGNFCVATDKHGAKMILDRHYPSRIAAAFSMTDAVDKFVELHGGDPNALFAVELATSRRLARELQIGPEKRRDAKADGKHFAAPCYIYSLDD